MTDTAEIAAHVRRGLIPAYVYSDPDVFDLERDRIFGHAWVFVAHESETRNSPKTSRRTS